MGLAFSSGCRACGGEHVFFDPDHWREAATAGYLCYCPATGEGLAFGRPVAGMLTRVRPTDSVLAYPAGD